MGLSSRLLSFSKGGIFQYDERRNFISLIQNNDSKQINAEFGLDINQGKAFYEYLKYVTVEYLFNGLFISKTPEEFLWGYSDKYVEKIVTNMDLNLI